MLMNEIFWNNVKSLLKEKKLSQNAFARLLEVEIRTFQDWVYSKRLPTVEMAKKIADKLEVSLDYLLTGTMQDNPVLTADEKELIDFYRKTANVYKNLVVRQVEVASKI